MRIRLLLLLPLLAGIFFPGLHGQTTFGDLDIDRLGSGVHKFKLKNLPSLNATEPAEVHSDPQYQVFVETGDGYYFREMMDPNATEHSFDFEYTRRVIKEEDVNVFMTPLYSPNKRPGIPDSVSFPVPFDWSPSPTGSSQKYDFIDQGRAAYADMNWFSFEPADTIVVVAGYQDSNPDLDLSDGAVISIYYDDRILNPVLSEGAPTHRSYNAVNAVPYSFPNDPVIDQYSDHVNAHLDYEAQGPVKGEEEFIYTNFKLVDAEIMGEEADFKVIVVVRRGGNQQIFSNDFESEIVDGEVRTVRDPNLIEGSPNPLCMATPPDFIEYRIEFFNSGDAVAKKFDLDIELSDYIQLANQSDIEITYLRIGNDILTDLNSQLMSKPEITGNLPARIFWSLRPVDPNVYLSGFGSTELEFNPSYYPYCSAEIRMKLPRNAAIESCDSIPAKLTITFENGIPVSRADVIMCSCDDGSGTVTPTGFPCNIVPQIPFLGGCWCTLLVILFLIVIFFLIIVIRRNSSGS